MLKPGCLRPHGSLFPATDDNVGASSCQGFFVLDVVEVPEMVDKNEVEEN